MATISGGSAVLDGAFATIFDIPLFGQLDDSQRACFSTGTEIRVKAGETLALAYRKAASELGIPSSNVFRLIANLEKAP